MAIEYPRERDVSEAIGTVIERLPNYLKERAEDLEKMLTELAGVRGPALYGYEVEGIPASEAFTSQYAAETLEKTKPLVELCVKFATETPTTEQEEH